MFAGCLCSIRPSLLATAAALLGRVASAQACTLPCEASVAFPSVRSIPANLISFKVAVDEPGTLSLAKADGEPIATHIVMRGGERIFEPVEPPAAGQGL